MNKEVVMEKWYSIDIGKVKNKRYQLERILYDEEGLTISLFDNDIPSKSIMVRFEYIVQAYRVMEERYRLTLFGRLKEMTPYVDKTFFRVENSEYLKWCSKESGTISENEEVIHYAFITDDFVIDVIADEEPIIIN